jgi:hypothetical protein
MKNLRLSRTSSLFLILATWMRFDRWQICEQRPETVATFNDVFNLLCCPKSLYLCSGALLSLQSSDWMWTRPRYDNLDCSRTNDEGLWSLVCISPWRRFFSVEFTLATRLGNTSGPFIQVMTLFGYWCPVLVSEAVTTPSVRPAPSFIYRITLVTTNGSTAMSTLTVAGCITRNTPFCSIHCGRG